MGPTRNCTCLDIGSSTRALHTLQAKLFPSTALPRRRLLQETWVSWPMSRSAVRINSSSSQTQNQAVPVSPGR